MANRSTSNAPGEISKPSPSPTSHPSPETNTVKRNPGPVNATDTTPTSEPLAEQPEKSNDDDEVNG